MLPEVPEKTTVKDMLISVLKQKYSQVVATYQNQNNEVGVPLTLLKIDSTTQVAVVEMAMRALGEIDYVARIACPTHCLITNIGVAHIEQLGSQAAIAAAKAEIFQPKSKAFINQSDPFASFLEEQARQKQCQMIAFQEDEKLNQNQALVEAVALDLGLTKAQIKKGLSQVNRSEHRMQFLKAFNGAVLIDDTYNANPDSVAYFILQLKSQRKQQERLVLVLGDMLELGSEASRFHAQIPAEDLDLVVTFGPHMKALKKGKRNLHFDQMETLIEWLKKEIQPSDIIGVKGSRGMHMERAIQALLSS